MGIIVKLINGRGVKSLVILFLLVLAPLAKAYNIKLFDAKPFSLKDKAFYDETCPKNEKGEGYCNKDYYNYTRLRFFYRSLSELNDWPYPYLKLSQNLTKMYPTNFTLYDKDLKPALVYNEKGIFFHGRKLCDLLKPWRIPHLNNKLCPAALGELPFRFTADIDGTVSDFEILLKEYDEKKNSGWTMFRGEKLLFNPAQKNLPKHEYKKANEVIDKDLPLIEGELILDQKMLELIKKVRAAIKAKDSNALFYGNQNTVLGVYRSFFSFGRKSLFSAIKTNDYVFTLLDECTKKGKFRFYRDKKSGSSSYGRSFFATGTGLETEYPIFFSCSFDRDSNGDYKFNLWITDEFYQGSNYSFSIRY